MTEYIIRKTGDEFKIVGELTRCRECVLKEKNPGVPYTVRCSFYGKSQPGNGFCHLGERGKDEHGQED